MLGYWGRPGATAAALGPGGWLRTGDLAALAQRQRPLQPGGGGGGSSSVSGGGCSGGGGVVAAPCSDSFVFLGRAKDMIKTGGENVFAAEVRNLTVEDLSHTHTPSWPLSLGRRARPLL